MHTQDGGPNNKKRMVIHATTVHYAGSLELLQCTANAKHDTITTQCLFRSEVALGMCSK